MNKEKFGNLVVDLAATIVFGLGAFELYQGVHSDGAHDVSVETLTVAEAYGATPPVIDAIEQNIEYHDNKSSHMYKVAIPALATGGLRAAYRAAKRSNKRAATGN